MRRDLGHIDGGERVDANVDAVVFTRLPDGGDPLIRQRLNGVRWDVDLEIEIANAMLDRRLDPVLDARPPSDIQADPIPDIHARSSLCHAPT